MSDAKRPASVTLVDLFDDETTPVPDGPLPRGTPLSIDVWDVDAVLGRSAGASVYACHNRNAPRIRAALKVPQAEHPAAVADFQREARLLAHLDHPNIVSVRNIRLDHHPPYIEMPILDGEDLQDVLSTGPLVRTDLLRTAAGLCAAVAHLEARGVHHRDLKPGNVRLGRDGPVVFDFGVACSAAEPAPDGELRGTVGYLPPEWSPDAPGDGGARDRYALGVVLFECSTGRLAFPLDPERSRLEQLMAVQEQVAAQDHLDPGPDHPRGVRELVRRLTHRAPEQRAVPLAAVAEALAALAEDQPGADDQLWTVVTAAAARSEPPVVVPVVAAPSAPSPRPRLAVVGGAALAAVLGAAVALMWPEPPAPGSGTMAVRLALELVPAESPLPVSVALDGVVFEPTARPTLSPGAHQLTARVGVQCGGASLPAWCSTKNVSFDVPKNTREHILHTLKLPAVVAQPVQVSVAGARPQRVRVDGGPWTACGVDCATTALPGPARALVVQRGTCPDDPCGEQCPAGCLEASTSLAVPFSATALRAEFTWPEAPEQSAPVVSSGPGRPITVGAFRAFLKAHPEYVPGGSAARRDADARYLPGWEGTDARDRFTGAPLPSGALVDGVSPRIYAAFCASRGGVARMDDGPPQLGGRDYELRQADGGWVAMDASGATRPVHDSRGALRHFTARCRR